MIELELLRCRDLVLNRLFIVRPPAIRTGTLFVGGLETVEAELADLDGGLASSPQSDATTTYDTYLIAARAWSEILVGEIKLFNT